jgi:peptide/nickel transport system substrate-binding protein
MGPARSLIVAVVCAVVFAACADSERGDPTPVAATNRGGALQVAMVEPAYQGFDPQASYTPPQFELLRCCLVRTLMTYQGLPNFEGTQPVPDLATDHPSVSTDGRTWTFHLRQGIRYAPPLQNVEVTAGDILRALLRAGASDAGGGPGTQYLASIDGFSEYARGDAETIAGVSTPDEHTLQVRQVRADRSIEHVFAMAFTAPIPPKPGDPTAALGVATGHPFASTFEGGPPQADGYGPFLVATGPYMIEGAEALDHTVPPEEQTPASGFSPGWWFDDPGSLILVRNPSWDSATDPNRPALPDRIEASIAPADNPYPGLSDGSTDFVMGENPPPGVLRDYAGSPELQDRIVTSASNFSRFVTINVAQPPFDDIHVRRATALVFDRETLVFSDTEAIASHLIPDPLVGGLLASWSGFPSIGAAGDVDAARTEMDLSRYGSDGMCTGAACRVNVVPPSEASPAMIKSLRLALRSVGMEPVFREGDCFDPRDHVALCATGWFTDFPDAGNMTVPFLASGRGFQPSLLGSTPRQLERWGYRTHHVPSVDLDYERCATLSGLQAAMCWARLDQLLTSEIVALVPISTAEVVRVRSGDITSFAVDQAFGEPALDRISVTDDEEAGGSPRQDG